MNILIDTHALIWFLNGDNSLSIIAKRNIESKNNKKYISIASLWEIAIKFNLGKFNYSSGLNSFFDLAFSNGFKILPINIVHILQLTKIENIHKDPFDRIIIAQAMIENMKICTIDSKIVNYNVEIIW